MFPLFFLSHLMVHDFNSQTSFNNNFYELDIHSTHTNKIKSSIYRLLQCVILKIECQKFEKRQKTTNWIKCATYNNKSIIYIAIFCEFTHQFHRICNNKQHKLLVVKQNINKKIDETLCRLYFYFNSPPKIIFILSKFERTTMHKTLNCKHIISLDIFGSTKINQLLYCVLSIE